MTIHKRLWDVARANVTDFAQAFTRNDDDEILQTPPSGPDVDASPGTRVGKHARHIVDAAEDAWEKAYRKAQERAHDIQDRVGSPSARSPAEIRANWYKTLEVPNNAELDEVRRAYRKLVAKYHPDRFAADPSKHAAATEVMRKITEAYDGLREHLEAAAR